jgi:leucine dehydrogenase
MGYTDVDDAALRETTTHVAPPGLGRVTAQGVRLALRAACSAERVAIQGLGAVGAELARMLLADGIDVVGSDVRPVEGLPTVPPEAILEQECSVFSPCAKGGVLDAAAIERLRCRVVCGAANNPLVETADADRLHARGIVYVPDFVANAAAVIEGASQALGEADRAPGRIAAIADRTREILAVAVREDRSPHHVAVEMADAAVARACGR